ncbi:hypothetical protein NPIL_633241 [Nephila pilipes]|uniref:Uncharacterized protein n=1 Tax=Nephila pilipes TaxID=299642 RepID=A0A8X6PHH1_NEPPI|nr:hypothetical protein NPIL_633241 [Nephila pilipes]
MRIFKVAVEGYKLLITALESYRRIRESRRDMGFILRTREVYDNVQAQTAELNALLITTRSQLIDIWVQIIKLIKFPLSDRSDMYNSYEKRCLRTLDQNLYELAALGDDTLTLCASISNLCLLFRIEEIY